MHHFGVFTESWGVAMALEGSSDLTERDVSGWGLRFKGDHVTYKLSQTSLIAIYNTTAL